MDSAEVTAHLPSLRRLARRLVSDEDAADELVTESLAIARAKGNEARDLPRYAAGALRFLARRRNAREARRREHERASAQERARTAPGSDTIAERVELMGSVLEEIRRLPAGQSRAVGLRYVDDLTVAEIAEIEGCTPSTVRSQLARGLATVRERLDARHGGRVAWSSVLAPWAFDPAHMAETSTPGAGAKAAAKAAAGTTTGVLGGALLTMTSLKIVLIASPLALAATWFASTRDVDLSGLNRNGTAALDERDGPLAPLPSDTALSVDQVATGASGRSAAPEASTAKATVAAPNHAVEGRVVSAASGTPQPGIEVQIVPLGEGMPRETLKAVTSADGRFSVDEAELPAGELFVTFCDAESSFPIARGLSVAFPFERELECDGPEAIYFSYQNAEAIPNGTQCGVQPDTDIYAMASTRPGSTPWVRFDSALKSSTSELRLRAQDGFHFGSAPLGEHAGTREAPLPVTFTRGGKVAFRAAPPAHQVSNAIRIRRADDAGAPPLRVSLQKTESGDSWGAETTHLAPGNYTWEYRIGAAVRTGAFAVRALETTQVDVEAPAFADSSTSVLIDASAAPDAPVDQWRLQAIATSDVSSQMWFEAQREGAAESGLWTVAIESLPPGEWQFIVGDVEGYTLSQQILPIERDAVNGPILVMPAAPAASAVVRVVDAATGDLIPNASMWILHGMQGKPSELSRSGEFADVKLETGMPSSLFATADGYGLAQLEYVPGQSATELTFRLHKGWRSRVLVFDMAKQRFAEGVNVHADGELVGSTESDGALWLDGQEAPERVEVGRGQSDFEVIMDPFAEGHAQSMDTPGYVFVVRSL